MPEIHTVKQLSAANKYSTVLECHKICIKFICYIEGNLCIFATRKSKSHSCLYTRHLGPGLTLHDLCCVQCNVEYSMCLCSSFYETLSLLPLCTLGAHRVNVCVLLHVLCSCLVSYIYFFYLFSIKCGLVLDLFSFLHYCTICILFSD